MKEVELNTMPFSKGDIIIRKDNRFPHGALIVDRVNDDGTLTAHPQGGGFEMTIKPAAVESFRVVSQEEIAQARYQKTRFCLEGLDGEFEGWTDDTKWNGWDCPAFEFGEAARLAEQVNTHYDEARDCFISENEPDEPEVWSALEIEGSNGDKVKVYPVGSRSWCWDEISKD
jgi:hypothetical protein